MAAGGTKMAATATTQHLSRELAPPTLALPHSIGWGAGSAALDWLCLQPISTAEGLPGSAA